MKTTHNLKQFGAVLASTLLLSTLAHAHTGHGSTSGFMHGFEHPMGGLDHLLAMVAVGLWAAQLGKRALWAVPATFVAVMTLGGIMGAAGVALPFVEQGILASVLVLGVLVATAARLPLAASMAIVGAFALMHGHAHGAEMPGSVSGLTYGLGFVLATAALHSVGIALGLSARKITPMHVTRFAGAGIALCSVYLFLK